MIWVDFRIKTIKNCLNPVNLLIYPNRGSDNVEPEPRIAHTSMYRWLVPRSRKRDKL